MLKPIRAFVVPVFLYGVLCCVYSNLGYCQVIASKSTTFRVMTFNMWHGGDAGGQPLEQSIEVIRRAKADVVGLQEAEGYAQRASRPNRGQEMAQRLGWNFLKQPGRRGILSRFPIVDATERAQGAKIELPNGSRIAFYNVHFAASPYQPYQLLNIKYGVAPFIKTEAEAIEWAEKSRGVQVKHLLDDMQSALASSLPIVLTGDFNEPSFQDWSQRASDAQLCPIKVEYPSTKRVVNAGLFDAFRTTFKDEVAKPGWTWTPTTKPDDASDKHDRIDFVFASNHWDIKNCQIVGESEEHADIVVAPWPSDHRAVVAEIRLK